jgi:hypothetical protein
MNSQQGVRLADCFFCKGAFNLPVEDISDFHYKCVVKEAIMRRRHPIGLRQFSFPDFALFGVYLKRIVELEERLITVSRALENYLQAHGSF